MNVIEYIEQRTRPECQCLCKRNRNDVSDIRMPNSKRQIQLKSVPICAISAETTSRHGNTRRWDNCGYDIRHSAHAYPCRATAETVTAVD